MKKKRSRTNQNIQGLEEKHLSIFQPWKQVRCLRGKSPFK